MTKKEYVKNSVRGCYTLYKENIQKIKNYNDLLEY